MAYGTIFEWHYKDYLSIDTLVRIKQNGYSGAVTVRNDVNSGCRFEWGDANNTIPIIYGSQVSVGVDSETEGELSFLFDADARKHQVEIYKDGALFWMGFIEPDSYQEPLIPAPYGIEFKAYDMLGFLDVDFLKEDKSEYTGTMTMIALIQLILAKTGLILTLNTATDFIEENQPQWSDYFEEHLVNLEAFSGQEFIDVLRQILSGHRIQQRHGEWYVVSNTLMPAGGNITFKQYLNGSSTAAGTVIKSVEDSSNWWIEGEANKKTLPALKQISVDQDFGYEKSILKNGDFTQINPDGSLKYWVVLSPFEYTIKPVSDSGDVYLYIPHQSANIPIWEKIYNQVGRLENGNGVIKISLEYAIHSETRTTTSPTIQISLLGDSGAIYYIEKQEVDDEEIWVWKTGITPYVIIAQNQFGVPVSDLEDNFRTFKAVIENVPEPGIFSISLLKPDANKPNINALAYQNVSVELTLDADDDYSGSQVVNLVNSESNNYEPDEISLSIGVIPDIANKSILYKGGIMRSDLSQSSAFSIDGNNYFDFAELIARIHASAQRSPRRAYEGTFADLVPTIGFVITHAAGNNIRLIETGIAYDDTMRSIDGQYIEILMNSLVLGQDANYTVTTTSGTGSSSSSGSSGSGGGGGKTTVIQQTMKAPAVIKNGTQTVLKLDTNIEAYADGEKKFETNSQGTRTYGRHVADDVRSSDYAPDVSGFRVGKDEDGKSRGEMDELYVRSTLFAREFVINQTRATNGNMIVANAARVETVESIAAFMSSVMTIPESYLTPPYTIRMRLKVSNMDDFATLLQLAHVTLTRSGTELRVGQRQYIDSEDIPFGEWFWLELSYYDDDTEAAALLNSIDITRDYEATTANGASPSLLGTDNSNNDSIFSISWFEIIDEVAVGSVYTFGDVVLTNQIGEVLISHNKYLPV